MDYIILQTNKDLPVCDIYNNEYPSYLFVDHPYKVISESEYIITIDFNGVRLKFDKSQIERYL